jgi:hypothetical protein
MGRSESKPTDFNIAIAAPESGPTGSVECGSTQRPELRRQAWGRPQRRPSNPPNPTGPSSGLPTTFAQHSALAAARTLPDEPRLVGAGQQRQSDGQKPDLPDQQVLVSPAAHVGDARPRHLLPPSLLVRGHRLGRRAYRAEQRRRRNLDRYRNSAYNGDQHRHDIPPRRKTTALL